MEQHYAVGQYFRKRYIEGQPYRLLSESYDRHQVHVRSFNQTISYLSCFSVSYVVACVCVLVFMC